MSNSSQAESINDSFITHFVTTQGVMVHTRLIRPQDAPLLIDLFDHLSAETRRRRFHVSAENVGRARIEETAQQLVNVDNHSAAGAVLALTDTGALIGVARLARPLDDVGADHAEVAVVMRDDYHRQGIGLVLLGLLVRLAQSMGIETLTATVQADNTAILSMVRRLNLPVQSHTRHGETDLKIALQGKE